MKLKNIFDKPGLSKFSEQLSLVLLGVILAILLLRAKSFEFDPKINLINFLVILLTFVISFNLQHALTGRASDDRVEKGIIIEHLRKIGSRLEKIGLICTESASGEIQPRDARAVLGEFKELNGELHTIEILLEFTPIKLDLEKLRALQGRCKLLKQRVTGGSFPSQPLHLEDNSAIQAILREIRVETTKLIFHVNRM